MQKQIYSTYLIYVNIFKKLSPQTPCIFIQKYGTQVLYWMDEKPAEKPCHRLRTSASRKLVRVKRKRRAKSTGKGNFWRELALKYRHNSIYRQPRYTIKKKEEWGRKKRKIGKLIFQQSACIIADRKFRVTIRSPDRETMASWEVNTLLYLRSHRGRCTTQRKRAREAERSRGKREVSSAVFLVKRAVDTSHTRILLPVFPERKVLKGTEGLPV